MRRAGRAARTASRRRPRRSQAREHPYAPLNLLLLDPHLPPWLPEITLRNLRVGGAAVTLRFSRKGDSSEYEVLETHGRLHVIRQPSPWSLTAGFAERLRDVLSSLLPGAGL